jgi:hypothetical protein
MASNFQNPIYDFEFSINPIVTYNFSVDFTQSALSVCPGAPLTLTNASVGTSLFNSHSFSLSAFAERYNVPEGMASGQLPRDSVYSW